MKKIISFKKDINFNNNISEIVSISLDHSLDKEESMIKGEFVVSGEYKLTDTSVNVESFSYNLPFTTDLNDYILTKANIDIDDFYYEIINNNVLSVNIDVSLDNIEEKLIEKEPEIEPIQIEEPVRCIEEENIIKVDNSEETYRSYTVYIVREGDTIEQIIEKYETTKEILLDYNDLTEIKLGDKIIIPC